MRLVHKRGGEIIFGSGFSIRTRSLGRNVLAEQREPVASQVGAQVLGEIAAPAGFNKSVKLASGHSAAQLALADSGRLGGFLNDEGDLVGVISHGCLFAGGQAVDGGATGRG